MGCCFDTLNIRAMTKFCQGKTTHIFTLDSPKKSFLMNFSATVFNHFAVQTMMNSNFYISTCVKYACGLETECKKIDIVSSLLRCEESEFKDFVDQIDKKHVGVNSLFFLSHWFWYWGSKYSSRKLWYCFKSLKVKWG